jgi:hypothetical protein
MSELSIGELLSEVVKDQLADERDIKNSLAQRATVLIAGSGTIITLSLASIGLMTRQQSFIIPLSAVVFISGALVALISATVLALMINAPWRQGAIDLDSPQFANLESRWRQKDNSVAVQILELYLDLLRDLRSSNRRRTHWLIATLALELLAFLSLCASVGIILEAGI